MVLNVTNRVKIFLHPVHLYIFLSLKLNILSKVFLYEVSDCFQPKSEVLLTVVVFGEAGFKTKARVTILHFRPWFLRITKQVAAGFCSWKYKALIHWECDCFFWKYERKIMKTKKFFLRKFNWIEPIGERQY